MPSWSRRETLGLGTASALSVLAGCAGLGGGTPTETDTPDPDAGTNRYGIALRNTSETDVRIKVEVKQPFEEDPVKWERTLDLAVGDEHTWSGLITEQEEYSVVANLNEAIDGQIDDLGKQRAFSENLWLTPASDTAPDVAKIHVVVDSNRSTEYPWVSVTAGPPE